MKAFPYFHLSAPFCHSESWCNRDKESRLSLKEILRFAQDDMVTTLSSWGVPTLSGRRRISPFLANGSFPFDRLWVRHRLRMPCLPPCHSEGRSPEESRRFLAKNSCLRQSQGKRFASVEIQPPRTPWSFNSSIALSYHLNYTLAVVIWDSLYFWV